MRVVQRLVRECEGPLRLRFMVQEGSGKGDAVWKRFAAAEGDILMIFDAEKRGRKFHRCRSAWWRYLSGGRTPGGQRQSPPHGLHYIKNEAEVGVFSNFRFLLILKIQRWFARINTRVG